MLSPLMRSRSTQPWAFALIAAGLVLSLSCCQKEAEQKEAEQKESSAPPQQGVWEGEMVANPEEFEMTPSAPPVQQSAPELAVAPEASPEPQPAPAPTTIEPPVQDELKPAAVTPAPVVETPKVLEARMLLGSAAVDEALLLEDLEAAIASGDWKAYRDQLLRSLKASIAILPEDMRGDQLQALIKEPAFRDSLLRWKMLKLFPPALWVNAADAASYADFTRHVLGKHPVMEEVLMTVQLEDDVLKVLPMMINLWDTHTDKPELAAKYFNLNLACSVVFDQELKLVNQESESEYEYASGVDARTRYEWYVKQNERGYLEVSIDRSSARDLCFVVCAPVSESELDWAVKEYRSLRRKSWGRTYGEIEYLMERAVDGLDPYDSYILSEIQKEGGICGDQTHFCVNTARAAGIPAIGLSGTTDAGPHAWAAVKIEDDEWTTEIGRIKGVSQGSTKDPQTGNSITEQDIWMWSSREYRRVSRRLELQGQLWLAQLFGQLEQPGWQRQVVDAARRDGEPYPEYWQVLYESLKADPTILDQPDEPKTLERWQDFCDDLKREFKENPRMSALAIQVEEEHLFVHMELGDIRRQLDRDRRRQQREASEQVDLITTSLKREADWILNKLTEKQFNDERDRQEAMQQALRDISQLYDKSLREYGKSVSGFATMADDYFAFVKDDEDLAPKAVRDIELAFKRVVDTDSDDWFRAQTEVGLHRRICQMYRQVGEEKRADVMERRLETQMERARRKAL